MTKLLIAFIVVIPLLSSSQMLDGGPLNKNKSSPIPYEIKVTSEGAIVVSHRTKHELRLDVINSKCEVIRSEKFLFRDINTETNSRPSYFFYVDNYYYYLSQHLDDENKILEFYLYQINCNTLEMELKKEKVLTLPYINYRQTKKIHIDVSPDEKSFSFAYHKPINPEEKDPHKYLFNYVTRTYSADFELMSEFEYSFNTPGEYFKWYKKFYELSNSGNVLCSKTESDVFYFVSPLKEKINKVEILESIQSVDSKIIGLGVVRVLNSEQNKDIYCVTYRYRGDEHIIAGFSILEITSDFEVNILSMNEIPKKHINQMRLNTNGSQYDAIYGNKKHGFSLYKWAFLDFFEHNGKYFLVSEHSTAQYNLHISPPESAHMGGSVKISDVIVYRLDSEFNIEFSYLIPKHFLGDCANGDCGKLNSWAKLRAYSISKSDMGISLYYWNREANIGAYDINNTSKRYLNNVRLYSSDLALYKTTIPINNSLTLTNKIIDKKDEPYPISANTGYQINKFMYFYAYKGNYYRVVKLPLN
ncbi:MAG: hypothetical protein ACPGEG_00180 [Salibacteraceae bacterium]